MRANFYDQKHITIFMSALLVFFLSYSPLFSRTITQLTPMLTITEEYSDNYLKTETNKQEEYITSIGLGFSVGFLEKTRKIYLAYNPEYKKYKNLDDNDRFEHKASLDSEFNLTKYTNIYANLAYAGHNEKDQGDSWENTVSISGDSALTKNTDVFFSQEYVQSFDQQERTGIYKEHVVNTTVASITNQFGENDRMGLNFLYEFDEYDNSDSDEYTKISPTAFITYWFTPLNGLDSNISYEDKSLENSSDDIETYEGHIRYLRKFSKHFDGYLKYRHYYTDENSGDHTIYHPSSGFDWKVTEDSGVSLGLGVLFQEWELNDESSTDPFIDLDVYKTFNFSQRGSLTLTANSGYEESTEENINQGFSIYYQTGFQLDYQLQKGLFSNLYGTYRVEDFQGPTTDRDEKTTSYETGGKLNYQLLRNLSTNLYASFTLDEYNETGSTREDETVELGGGLSWSPLKWLRFNLTYTFTDFTTNTSERGDYTENAATFYVSIIPARPIGLDVKTPIRQPLQYEIKNNK